MTTNFLFRLLIFFICISPFKLVAQPDYYETVAAVNYNIPIGQLSWVYKPSIGIQAGVNWVNEQDDKIKKTGVLIGFTQFQPKEDTLYYLVPPNSYGTATFSNYLLISAKAHLERIKTFNKFGLIAGADLGLALVKYSSHVQDINFDSGEDNIEVKLIVCPLLGFNFRFTENISSALMVQYNALVSLGNNDPESIDYNANAGMYRQFGSICLKVAYAF